MDFLLHLKTLLLYLPGTAYVLHRSAIHVDTVPPVECFAFISKGAFGKQKAVVKLDLQLPLATKQANVTLSNNLDRVGPSVSPLFT